MFYLLLPNLDVRTHFIQSLRDQGIVAVFHYIPLHSSPAGQRLGRVSGSMDVTDQVSDCLVRMPLWLGLEEHLDDVLATAHQALASAIERAA
jgi:dTDP-4-amino-4,6-dideoxygalactose transaminase